MRSSSEYDNLDCHQALHTLCFIRACDVITSDRRRGVSFFCCFGGRCVCTVFKLTTVSSSRPYAFAEDENAANAAKEAMDGQEIMGRAVAVNNARQKVDIEPTGDEEGGGDDEGGDDGAME